MLYQCYKECLFISIFFSENFHTLALDGIPVFGVSNKSAAQRFVTLIDVSPFSYLKWVAYV